MVDHWLLKWLLAPLAALFAIGVAFKNFMYRRGFLSSVQFSVPVVSVGNLTVGGAGKTPHVEYLIRLFRPYIRTAVLSRGYGRNTTGFQLVHPQSNSRLSGDEPLIYSRKYRDVRVAVSESRSIGVPMLMQHDPAIQLVLLDDAFQHRSVEPYVNILITEYGDPYFKDWPLPVGRLREWRSGAERADIIIVSKCPDSLVREGRSVFLRQLKAHDRQQVYFTTYSYRTPYTFLPPVRTVDLTDIESALIVCGIARPDPVLDHVATLVPFAELIEFSDHHEYSRDDLELIDRKFQSLDGTAKCIITTEKDAIRLEPFGSWIVSHQWPLFILPVEVVFLFEEGHLFDNYLRELLLNFKT